MKKWEEGWEEKVRQDTFQILRLSLPLPRSQFHYSLLGCFKLRVHFPFRTFNVPQPTIFFFFLGPTEGRSANKNKSLHYIKIPWRSIKMHTFILEPMAPTRHKIKVAIPRTPTQSDAIFNKIKERVGVCDSVGYPSVCICRIHLDHDFWGSPLPNNCQTHFNRLNLLLVNSDNPNASGKIPDPPSFTVSSNTSGCCPFICSQDTGLRIDFKFFTHSFGGHSHLVTPDAEACSYSYRNSP